jgi:mono/diheme cytochrome c family protein
MWITENRGRGSGAGGRGFASSRLRASLLLVFCCALLAGCRQDMQDQPRYEAYEQSKFFADGQASRPYVEGTVARGYLRDDTAFYQGRRGAAGAQQSGGAQQQPGGASQQQQGASSGGGALVGSQQVGQQGAGGGGAQGVLQTTSANVQGAGGAASQPGGEVNVRGGVGESGARAGETQGAARDGLVTEFPFQITAADLDRGQERYRIYCSVCHGMTGFGDGMIVRRGFRRPPSYHDDRLRSEPYGHFFDVITNGWGAMPSYADMIPPDDRWRIIAYVRALQLSQQAKGAQQPPPPQQQPQQPGGQGSGGVHRR